MLNKHLRSALDDVPGIGPVKRKALLTHFGSLKKIEIASEEELRQVKGISKANISLLKLFFKEKIYLNDAYTIIDLYQKKKDGQDSRYLCLSC